MINHWILLEIEASPVLHILCSCAGESITETMWDWMKPQTFPVVFCSSNGVTDLFVASEKKHPNHSNSSDSVRC